jgi:hypothetical protein
MIIYEFTIVPSCSAEKNRGKKKQCAKGLDNNDNIEEGNSKHFSVGPSGSQPLKTPFGLPSVTCRQRLFAAAARS